MTMVSSGLIGIGGTGTVGGLNQSINVEVLRSPTAATSLNDAIVRSLAQRPTGAVALSDCYGKTLIGSSWGQVNLRDNVFGATFGNGLFVVVGASGSIATSTNGINWIRRASGTTEQLNSVVWTGSQFVIGGNTGVILTSPTGVTWTLRSLGGGLTNNLVTLSTNGSRIVAAGTGLFSSTDGISWTQHIGGVFFQGSAYGQNQFVAVGGSAIRTSPDGVTWTTRTAPTSTNLRCVEWSGSAWVALGTSGQVRTSPDAITWTTRTGQGSTITWNAMLRVGSSIGCFGGQSGTSAVYGVTSDGITFSYPGINFSPALGSRPIFAAANSGSRLCTFGTRFSYFSTSGLTQLQQGTNGTTTTLRRVVWNGSIFCAVGNADGFSAAVAMTSSDGLTWTRRTPPGAQDFYGLAWGLSLFVAGGTSSNIITSPDGVTWTSRSTPLAGQTILDIAFGAGRFVATLSGTTTYFQSTDGVNWATATYPAGVSINQVTFGNGLFIAVGFSGVVLRSSDGINWVQQNITANQLTAVVWTGARFIAVGVLSTVATSTDGVSWSVSTMPLAGSAFLNSIGWSGALAVAGVNAFNTAYATETTASWSATVNNTFQSTFTSPSSSAFSPQRGVMVTENGVILASPPPATMSW